jgi:hypothetical protein
MVRTYFTTCSACKLVAATDRASAEALVSSPD